ncbi:MAG TPA: hypothetical protein VK008_05500 [Sphingobacteriaceae bacterium]|nr:hypothetical protein [Sphingobacteriaceae bacterium]
MTRYVSMRQADHLGRHHRWTAAVAAVLLGLVLSLALAAGSAGVAWAQTDASDPMPQADFMTGDEVQELDDLGPMPGFVDEEEQSQEHSLVDEDPLGEDVDAEEAADMIGEQGDDIFVDVPGEQGEIEEPLLDDEDAWADFDFDNEPLQIVEEHPEPLIAPPPEQEAAEGGIPWLWIVLPVALVAALVLVWRRPHASR